MLLETKEAINQYYPDHTGNLYVNGEIVDGFSEEEVCTALNNGALVEFFNSTKTTTREVAEEAIEKFIKGRWEPGFHMVDTKGGPKIAELSLVGDANLKEMVYGCLYNISALLDIEPVEASDRFKRLSLDVLNKIHFGITPEQLAKINAVDKRLAEMNAELTVKIEKYDEEHDECIRDVFIEELYTAKPVKKAHDLIREMVLADWHVGIGIVESDNHPVLHFVTGEYIHEMVFILGISHDEAVKRFDRANRKCAELIDLDDPKKVSTMFFGHRLKNKDEGMAMYAASEEVALRIINWERKKKGNNMTKLFADELLVPKAILDKEDNDGTTTEESSN